MKIILSILTLLLIGFIIYYLLKKKLIENYEIKGDKQPEVSEEIYNYNVEQAKKIWDDIVGPDANGSYRPTRRNRRIWAHESWREELKAYVKEAEKFNKEHNWFDYVPGRGKSLIIKRRDVTREKVSPIGIRKAWKRIYGDNLGNYKYPKAGDRVRILQDDNSNKKDTDYYTGIVLSSWGWGNKRCKVIWDKRNTGNTSKDRTRYKTKGLASEIIDVNVEKSGKEYGWPYWNWKRHWSENKSWDSVRPTTWLGRKDVGRGRSHYNSKYLYKVVECKPKGTTGCDFLRCDKRKEAVLNDFPITYHCTGDARNRHPGIWKCTSGRNSGKFYNYYDKSKMCRQDYKRGKKDTFCVQDCRGRCAPTTLQNEIKSTINRSRSKCAYLVSDNPWRIDNGNYTFLWSDHGYFPRNLNADIHSSDTQHKSWRKYGNESRYYRVPKSKQKYMSGIRTTYSGGFLGWFRKKKRRRREMTLMKYGKGRNWHVVRGWTNFRHRCSHSGYQRGYFWDPKRGTYKECRYLDKYKTRIKVPKQKYTYMRSNILKDGKIRSMKVFGRGCKFATKNRYYGQGFHRNLNLKSGKTTCSLGRRAALYSGCGYYYQDRKACKRECGGQCPPKVINLSRHGCKYSRGNRIGGKRLIPL